MPFRSNGFYKEKIKQVLRIDRAISLVWQSTPGWTIAGAGLLVLQCVIPLLVLYLIKLSVDEVSLQLKSSHQEIAFQSIGLLIGLTGLVTFFGALISSLQGIVKEHQTAVFADHIEGVLHQKSISVDLAFYESSKYQDTLHRSQKEAPFRPVTIVNELLGTGQSGLTLLAMAGLLFTFHWFMIVILVISVVPGIFIRLKYADRLYDWQQRRTLAERKSNYLNQLLTNNGHAKEVRLFNLGPLLIERFRTIRRQLRREKLQMQTKRSVEELIAQVGIVLAIYGSFAFIAYRSIQGEISLGDLVMYYQAFQRGQNYLRELLTHLSQLYENQLFLSNFYEFLDLEPQITESANPVAFPSKIKSGIVFDKVRFSYPSGTRQVIEDLSFTIRPGEHIALVGENGSGKTTLIKLLCRLYDPTGGKIMIDGNDLKDYKTDYLRQEISVLFQDYAKYELSARENIHFGNIKLSDINEQIIQAAKSSGIHDTITGLTKGYDTQLGKLFKNGEELSIGEWQKIALARAFLRDAQILILDEPTASLDVETENEILQKFQKLTSGQTTIVITHRLNTIRMADRIIMLHQGKIHEMGSHEELMQQNGRYAHLFNMQAKHYKSTC